MTDNELDTDARARSIDVLYRSICFDLKDCELFGLPINTDDYREVIVALWYATTPWSIDALRPKESK